MRHLTLAARIGIISGLVFGGLWLAALALFGLAHAPQGGVRPPPAQLSALADLLDHAPIGQEVRILAAVRTETLSAYVETDVHVGPSPDWLVHRLGRDWLQEYADALAGRAVCVLSDGSNRRQPLRRWLRLPPRSLQYRIALSGDRVLVVDTRDSPLMGPFGLPTGVGAGLFASLVALVTIGLLSREARPLSRLARAVDALDPQIEGGPMLTQPRGAGPEYRALVDAFNRLQARLSQLIDTRMAMLGGISHDLRTFATRLRLKVEGIADEGERARAVSDIDDMIRLLDDALLASRAGARQLAQELVDLRELVSSEVQFRRAQGQPVEWVGEPAEMSVEVIGDRLALRRIVANLIDNAINYGQVARVALVPEGEHAKLSIEDDGPGIPPQDREAVFEPFVRLETSRSRSTGGSGLGLAIARNLLLAQRGTIGVSSASSGGALLEVRLPLFAPE